MIVTQPVILPFAMPGVEGVETDHVEGGLRQIVFHAVVEIFIVPPGEVHIPQTAALLIHTTPRLEAGIGHVGILAEELGVDDPLAVATADRKRVAHHRPLRLAKQTEHLAEVVQEACQHKPVGMSRRPDRLGRLQEVVDLREIDVGVGVIHQRVEVFQRLKHAHRAAVEL